MLETMCKSKNPNLAGRSLLALGLVQEFAVSPDSSAKTPRRAIELLPDDPRGTEILFTDYLSAKNYPEMARVLADGLKRSENAR